MGPGSIFEAALREQRILGPGSDRIQNQIQFYTEAFRAAGFRPRQLIGMSFENGVDCIAAYIAAAKYDLVVAPLPPTLPEKERQQLWERLKISHILDSKGLISIADYSPAPLWPDDIYWIMHSSGSTGIPKPIPLAWSAIQKNARDVGNLLQLKPNEIHFGSMSQCYTNGLYNSFLLPLVLQSKMVITPLASALRFKDYSELLKTFQPEIIWTNPTVLKMMMKFLSADDLKNTRMLVSCTAPLTKVDCLVAEAHFQKPVLQSYGLTETLIVTVERPERNAASEFSAGAVVGGPSAVHIRNDGLLIIENGAVTRGYAEVCDHEINFDLSEGGLSQKTFVSSDLVKLNLSGDLEITGRVSNMINVDGVKVSAEQIESFLTSQPGISQAAVVRIAFKDGRERPLAFVKAAGISKDQILDHCASSLGSKARPHSIVIVDEVPVNASGKVDRIEISRRYSELMTQLAEA